MKALELPVTGEVWSHYKGDLYSIVALGFSAKTGNAEVVYQAMYDPREIFTRDLGEFLGLSKTGRVRRFTPGDTSHGS